MFGKVLIANRGEIAVRIIRACRDLGISPVAVYSEADRTSLHVRLADEAYLLGAALPSESYLNIAAIIDAALAAKAEAIHPGYGFLSESPRFAQACAEAGLTMIGPSPDSMRLMGSKTGARKILLDSGVATVPGTYRALNSASEAVEEARRIGYPVMLKASAGGGGKGMRLVYEEGRMLQDFELASSEALRAFADGALYLEKYIAQPRHVEIQVLADKQGNAIYLGERECSLQRRHQKIIEECPSPIVNPDMRRRMGEAALGVVRAARYENAGTVEFLVDEKRNFYFLEMNTRLQVEHPVTEAVYGIDIVREQFRIASGEALSLKQESVSPRGWALECRIYAEDTENNFFPSPGLIAKLVEPSGPGVRLDSGVYEGWQVPIHYDPLIAKLTVAAADRAEAIERMRRALSEYRVEGIKTNLSFLLELVDDPEFRKGNLSTEFIPEFLNRRTAINCAPSIDKRAYAIAAVLSYCERLRASRFSTGSASQGGEWKYSGRPRRHQW